MVHKQTLETDDRRIYGDIQRTFTFAKNRPNYFKCVRIFLFIVFFCFSNLAF